MTHLIKDTFYKEKLYQVSVSSFSYVPEQGKQKDVKQFIPEDIIKRSLTTFGKTAEGAHYSYLSFICNRQGISSLYGIDKYTHLQHIDVSYNNISSLKPISHLKYVITLIASHNKLSKLLDLKSVPLQIMDVDCSFNDIEIIPDLSAHRFLRQLNLSNNKISQIEGLSNNKCLQILKLSNNSIERIENLDGLNLIELDLFGNELTTLDGLSHLPKLRKLELSQNSIKKLSGIIDLIALRELKLANNKIKRINELHFLENLVYLSVLDLCYNPIQNRRYYRQQALYRLPGLRSLDGVLAVAEEIVKAENLYGMDLEDRKRIFKEILPEEDFIDRRVHIHELIEPETESENEDQEFVDNYDKTGKLLKNQTKSMGSQKSLSDMVLWYINIVSLKQESIGAWVQDIYNIKLKSIIMTLWQIIVHFLKQNKRLSFYASVCLGAGIISFIKARWTEAIPAVKLSYFLLALKQNLVQDVYYNGSQVFFRCVNQDKFMSSVTSPLIPNKRLFQLLQKSTVSSIDVLTQPKFTENDMQRAIFLTSVCMCGIGLLAYELLRNQQFSQRSALENTTGVFFRDIYGLEHAKKQLQQIIEYLSEPLKFRNVGARLRRGIMLYGPPGTGKTMLAKATATESKVQFLYCSATEFMEVYVGTGPKRVRELFQKARQSAPAIIFIDEIDSIAYKRRNQNFATEGGSDNERVSTLNQLLTEIDGFKANDNIVVIAATNRIQVLDDALMRSGRFDIKIEIKMPQLKEREGILKLHLQNKKHKVSEGLIMDVAKLTEQCSGADMENITNESAYIAIERNNTEICDDDVKLALQKLMSEKQSIGQQDIFQ